MLFSESCSKGQLQINGTIVQVISPLQRVVWSVQRQEITYIGVKKGRVMTDLTIYTSTNHYPANFMAPQNAQKFLALFPAVPTGAPVQPQAYAPPPLLSDPQWNAAPTVPFQVPPPVAQPPKKKLPRWATIIVIILALCLCGGIGSAVVNAVGGNGSPQAQVVATPTATSQSSTLATTVTTDTPMPVPTQAPTPTQIPTPKPTPKPTPRPVPTRPPVPTPTPCSNPCNPWGYSFSPGSYITSPPSAFCSYFSCIASFWNGRGFVNECQDGEYSKSGGIRGDCSDHGGELRPLYAH